jgi:hypothetical protein
MINGLQDKNFPKSPANPNKNTARWILSISSISSISGSAAGI